MARVFNLNRKELKQYTILKLSDLEDTDYAIIRVKGINYIGLKLNSEDYRLNHRVDKMCKFGCYLVTIENLDNGYQLRGIDIDKGKIAGLGVFKSYDIFNDCIKLVTRMGNKVIIDGWYLDDEMEQGWY